MVRSVWLCGLGKALKSCKNTFHRRICIFGSSFYKSEGLDTDALESFTKWEIDGFLFLFFFIFYYFLVSFLKSMLLVQLSETRDFSSYPSFTEAFETSSMSYTRAPRSFGNSMAANIRMKLYLVSGKVVSIDTV